jgi:hypothetical protein
MDVRMYAQRPQLEAYFSVNKGFEGQIGQGKWPKQNATLKASDGEHAQNLGSEGKGESVPGKSRP